MDTLSAEQWVLLAAAVVICLAAIMCLCCLKSVVDVVCCPCRVCCNKIREI
jgi:hypothetical protein